MNFYVKQHHNFQLGNFINCTPTLKALYEKHKKPVPVLFETEYLADAFKSAKFIRQIYEPYGHKLFQSSMVNCDIPDWKYIYRAVIGQGEVPECYVDKGIDPRIRGYAVILRGCLNPVKFPQKDPGEIKYIETITYFLLRGIRCVFVGKETDREYSDNLFKCFGDDLIYNKTTIRKALGLVNWADYVVGNDTGLMHAAGALKKRAYCFWHDTNFEKNRARNVVYSKHKTFKEWLN